MNQIIATFQAHAFWGAVALYWLFSAAVSAMPDPSSNSSSGYVWLFKFLHTVAGDITGAIGSKIPGIPVSGPK